MRLVARLDEYNQIKVTGYILCQPLYRFLPVNFVLDTGATATCLLPDDVIRLHINYGNLQNAPYQSYTAGGRITPKLLPRALVFLPMKRGFLNRENFLHQYIFPVMPIIPPTSGHQPLPPHRIVSLLGMDVLLRFRNWRINSDVVTLDT